MVWIVEWVAVLVCCFSLGLRMLFAQFWSRQWDFKMVSFHSLCQWVFNICACRNNYISPNHRMWHRLRTRLQVAIAKVRHRKKNQWARRCQGSGGGKRSVDPIFCGGGPLRWRADTTDAAFNWQYRLLIRMSHKRKIIIWKTSVWGHPHDTARPSDSLWYDTKLER